MTEDTKLTEEEIALLPEEDRPGYLGEDDKGSYKVNECGVRKRPFEKGGPSPNPNGRISRSERVVDILDKRDWVSPLEFYMAVMNCDIDTINKIRGSRNGIPKSDISFNHQLRAAEKVLPYFAKPNKEDATDKGNSEEESQKPIAALRVMGRKALHQNKE